MTVVKTTIAVDNAEGQVVTTSVELVVDGEDAHSAGVEAGRLLWTFTSAVAEGMNEAAGS